MTTDLHVQGPFDISFTKKGRCKQIWKKHADEFWQNGHVHHLRHKQGCYIFAMRAGQGFTPWYVGQTSVGFEKEIFEKHKLLHYNTAIFKSSNGNPVLFFVSPMRNLRKVPKAELSHMETELTQYALKKNSKIQNIQNTKNTPRWSIKGVVRSGAGAPTIAARKFKAMMKM